MFTAIMNRFWDEWPRRVEAFVTDPSVSFTYRQENRGPSAIHRSRTRGRIGVVADPGLAVLFRDLCEEIGVYGPVREALARRVFSERLFYVLAEKEAA